MIYLFSLNAKHINPWQSSSSAGVKQDNGNLIPKRHVSGVQFSSCSILVQIWYCFYNKYHNVDSIICVTKLTIHSGMSPVKTNHFTAMFCTWQRHTALNHSCSIPYRNLLQHNTHAVLGVTSYAFNCNMNLIIMSICQWS